MTTDKFVSRHNGPRENEVKQMLAKIGVSSIDELIIFVDFYLDNDAFAYIFTFHNFYFRKL